MPLSNKILTAEKIFLIFIVPGLDMFRVFIERFINNKHPFSPDTNHLHHLMCNVFNEKDCIFTLYNIIMFTLHD